MKHAAALLIGAFFLAPAITAQDSRQPAKAGATHDCPMNQQLSADAHHTMVEKHGDHAMGFRHDKTTHHFRLTRDGGSVDVTANDPTDQANTEAIRFHLSNIAALFSNGDFSAPMYIHDMVPPGVTTMQLLKSTIRYRYEERPSGGRLRIGSSDPIGVAAIHDFLRFQITDHQTGDSLTVENAH